MYIMYNKVYLIAMSITIIFCLYSIYQQWKDSSTQMKIILVLVLTCVYLVGSKKTTYLPFLAETALPNKFINLVQSVPDGNTITKTITLKEKGEYLIYWAASENDSNSIPKVKDAYKDYSNSGIVKIDGNTVDLIVRKPSGYHVCTGYYVPPHIHYRIVKGNMLSDIQTVFL